MKSMTGYGSGSARWERGRVEVEIRTVNHRHLDVKVSLGAGRLGVAAAVERRIRERLVRGRVEASVSMESAAPPARRLEAVAAAYRALDGLRKEIGAEVPIDLGALYAATAADDAGTVDASGADAVAVEATDAALAQVEAMRAREGAALRGIVQAAIAEIGRISGTLATEADRLRAAIPERVRQRVAAALQAVGAGTLDPDRLALEVALAFDRADVTEEVERLRCHVDHLRSVLDGDGAVGRRAEFLAQEIVREANTLGAKSQDVSVSRFVADLRVVAEQVREQLQNVE